MVQKCPLKPASFGSFVEQRTGVCGWEESCQMAKLHRECQHGSGIHRRLQHWGAQPSNHQWWEVLGHCSARLGEERGEAPFLLLPSLLLQHTDFFLLVISAVQTDRAVENGWEPEKALSQGRGSVACSVPFLIPVQLLSLGRAAVHQVHCFP